MKLSIASLTLVAGLFAAGAAMAQAPAGAPAGSTGMCQDGSYTSHATKKGSCAGHKGVKDWFGGADAAAAPKAAATMPAPVPAAPAAPAPATVKAAAPATAKASAPATMAAGGGEGKVWVNTPSKVYHCPGTKFYGKTKQGEYMTESAAKAAGDRSEHGKACS
ncbi:MAG: hypothetical protein ABI589_09750 [Burkholderiales bacterium]